MAPRAETFAEALEVTAEVYHAAGKIMAERGHLQGVADEGGWWPAFAQQRGGPRHADAGDRARRLSSRRGRRHLARHRRHPNSARTAATGLALETVSSTATRMAEMLLALVRPLSDPVDRGPARRGRRRGVSRNSPLRSASRVQVIGDDYLVTSASRVREAARGRNVNAVLDQGQPGGHGHRSQCGLRRGTPLGFRRQSSRRARARPRTSIVHLAIGWGAGQLKVGSFARSERMAKWNEALRIEETLGSKARFAGLDELPMRRQAAIPVETSSGWRV